jgi:hypothetical protein
MIVIKRCFNTDFTIQDAIKRKIMIEKEKEEKKWTVFSAQIIYTRYSLKIYPA